LSGADTDRVHLLFPPDSSAPLIGAAALGGWRIIAASAPEEPMMKCSALPAIAVATALALPAAAQVSIFETDPAKIQAGWLKDKLQEIRSRDAKERADAARYLGGNKDAESIAALTNALRDPEPRVRMEAAGGLWKSEKAAEPAREALMATLDDADPNVSAQAAGALQALGMKEAELAPARKRVLASAQATPHTRYLVARNLVGFEEPARLVEPILGYLERAATSRSTDQRNMMESAQRSVARLVKTQDRSIAAALFEATRTLKGGNAVVLKALDSYDPDAEGYFELVLANLQARDPQMRIAALEVLRDRKEEQDIVAYGPRVAPLLRDGDEGVRSQAAWTLGRAAGLAAAQSEALAAALADPSARVRRAAAEALGYVGEGRQAMTSADRARVLATRPALQKLADADADADVRRSASGALSRMALGSDALAAVAPLQPGASDAEARAMALLRSKKIAFEPDMFQRALYSTDVEAVRAFLDAGMSAKAPFPGGRTPLLVLLFGGQTCNPNTRPTRPATRAVLQALLERGADPNLADEHGNTPLMFAASSGCDREVMKMLLAAGARIDAKNSAGLTPFEFGLMYAHDGIEELVAAGYRLPPDKVKVYQQAYADRPAAQVLIRKATATAPAAKKK
jgi:HEAT repeat protein